MLASLQLLVESRSRLGGQSAIRFSKERLWLCQERLLGLMLHHAPMNVNAGEFGAGASLAGCAEGLRVGSRGFRSLDQVQP